MPRARLKVYYGPENQENDAEVLEHTDDHRHTVEVTLREIFPVLADALRTRRSWLRDFEDDLVTISTDLYEVILAYQHYRRPAS